MDRKKSNRTAGSTNDVVTCRAGQSAAARRRAVPQPAPALMRLAPGAEGIASAPGRSTALDIRDVLPSPVTSWKSPGSPGRPSTAYLGPVRDRKSTRLNSSHGYISYAVFCLKKKK